MFCLQAELTWPGVEWRPMKAVKLDVRHVHVPDRNAHSAAETLRKEIDTFASGSLVLLSAGPLSEVLIYWWWKERQDCTLLDVGSVFDLFTRRFWVGAHSGNGGFCPSCSPVDGHKRAADCGEP